MTLYQELQLNQAGSKALIKNAGNRREKQRHIGVYILKVFLTMAFCVAFISAFTALFGPENSIAGVVVLLAVMVFRQAELLCPAGNFRDTFSRAPYCGCIFSDHGICCGFYLYFRAYILWMS